MRYSETWRLLQEGPIYSDSLISATLGILLFTLAAALIFAYLNHRHTREVERFYRGGFQADQTLRAARVQSQAGAEFALPQLSEKEAAAALL